MLDQADAAARGVTWPAGPDGRSVPNCCTSPDAQAAVEEAVSPAFELCVGVVGGAIYWCRQKWQGAQPAAALECMTSLTPPPRALTQA